MGWQMFALDMVVDVGGLAASPAVQALPHACTELPEFILAVPQVGHQETALKYRNLLGSGLDPGSGFAFERRIRNQLVKM